MKKYEIPENLVLAILAYLSKQPHGDVDAMIKAIHQIKVVNEPIKTIKNGTTE